MDNSKRRDGKRRGTKLGRATHLVHDLDIMFSGNNVIENTGRRNEKPGDEVVFKQTEIIAYLKYISVQIRRVPPNEKCIEEKSCTPISERR